MKRTLAILLFLLLPCYGVQAQDESVFDAKIDYQVPTVRVSFRVPPEHFLYAESVSIELISGGQLKPVDVPEPVTAYDPFSESDKEVYAASFTAEYEIVDRSEGPLNILVRFQGCSKEVCYFPEERSWTLEGTASSSGGDTAISAESTEAWRDLVGGFEILNRGSGYMSVEEFQEFLVQSKEPISGKESMFEGLGMWAAILAILLGGLALNLTPCVLPMIPINLAIIGAGAQAGSRTRGLLLGGAYGLAIAFTYGILGVVVVLTGSTFGALNASPWFNIAMAVIFVVLALAMFDVIHIDFSRFQGRMSDPGKVPKAGFAAAFTMGTVAALLAGACVAPVVIGVLVWAQDLYSRGLAIGLLLPFVLGLGMGLPWPVAGAGLSFLPKPGKWMNSVKMVFGVFILLLALYYAHLAYAAFQTTPLKHSEGQAQSTSAAENQRLADTLLRSMQTGKPVFIDFWATWCKNCLAMEKTTFKSPEVKKALESYHVLKYQAENPADPAVKEVLDYFKAIGLPTYIVLKPGDG